MYVGHEEKVAKNWAWTMYLLNNNNNFDKFIRGGSILTYIFGRNCSHFPQGPWGGNRTYLEVTYVPNINADCRGMWTVRSRRSRADAFLALRRRTAWTWRDPRLHGWGWAPESGKRLALTRVRFCPGCWKTMCGMWHEAKVMVEDGARWQPTLPRVMRSILVHTPP